MSLTQLPVFTHHHINAEWLKLHTEDILEPGRRIVDPHHHMWDHGEPYFVSELLDDLTSGHNIVATVYLQCHYGYRTEGPDSLRPVGETEFVVEALRQAGKLDDSSGVCAGIVGYADLQLGAHVDEVLHAHIDVAGRRFCGIRRLSAYHDEFRTHLPNLGPGLLADKRFREGFSRLDLFNLTYDAWVYHTQIDEVTDLARAYPTTPIVLNHMGGPLGVVSYKGHQKEVFQAWRTSLKALATCPNVYVKLGGLGMSICGYTFHENDFPPTSIELAEHWTPYIATCIELFGAERCMFESNFPVDKGMFSYPILWNAFKRIAKDASEDEKSALFHDTAVRFYSLPVNDREEPSKQ